MDFELSSEGFWYFRPSSSLLLRDVWAVGIFAILSQSEVACLANLIKDGALLVNWFREPATIFKSVESSSKIAEVSPGAAVTASGSLRSNVMESGPVKKLSHNSLLFI